MAGVLLVLRRMGDTEHQMSDYATQTFPIMGILCGMFSWLWYGMSHVSS